MGRGRGPAHSVGPSRLLHLFMVEAVHGDSWEILGLVVPSLGGLVAVIHWASVSPFVKQRVGHDG